MKKFLSVLALLLLIVQGSYAQKKFSAYGFLQPGEPV